MVYSRKDNSSIDKIILFWFLQRNNCFYCLIIHFFFPESSGLDPLSKIFG